jgi:uncharacterized protein YceK
MSISDARGSIGLTATGSPSRPNVSGTVVIGVPTSQVRLSDANVFYAVQALILGSGSEFVLDPLEGDKTGTTAWTAGVAQVETATAAGTITLAGNASVVVTAAGMTGSPKTIAVPVALSDTATAWATKVVNALAADPDVSSLFDVSNPSAGAIRLTRKPLQTYQVGSVNVPVYAANDGTLNIALDNGTCTGITPAASSANTTEGVLSAGCYVVGDGADFEGNALEFISGSTVFGLLIANSGNSSNAILISTPSTMTDLPLEPSASIQLTAQNGSPSPGDLTITTTTAALITICVAGEA